MDTPALPHTSSVSIKVAADASRIWTFISDPGTPALFSQELQEASFLDTDTPAKGAVIGGRNLNGTYEWSTLSTVVVCDEPHAFAWAVGHLEDPVATWSFDVTEGSDGSELTHTVTLYPSASSPFTKAIAREPERAHEIVQTRLTGLLANMQLTIEGIAALSEA